MFYSTFESLCKEHKTSPSAVCVEIGLSKTTSAYWKRTGNIPKRETLEAIAEYFGVSVDYLLCRDEPIAVKAKKEDWIRILNNFSDEDLLKLKSYAEFLLSQKDGESNG